MKKLAASLTIFLAATMGTYALADDEAPPAASANVDEFGLPLGPGHDLTVQKCTACHSAYEFAGAPRDKDAWRGTISDMIGKGAAISQPEFDQILTYLSTYVAPAGQGAPAAAPAPSAR